MSKITKGPWEVCNLTDVMTTHRDGDKFDGFQIADCMVDYGCKGTREMPYEEQRANAQAIAKVPEMIGLLREHNELLGIISKILGYCTSCREPVTKPHYPDCIVLRNQALLAEIGESDE